MHSITQTDTVFGLLRVFAGELHAAALRVFAYGCALAALGLVMADFVTTPQGAVAARAPQPEWIEIGRPYPAFALVMPELGGAPHYAIRRHVGGGRKDILTFGDPDAGPAALVEIYRPGSEIAETPEPGEDVTASVPDMRLSGATPASAIIDTKFGPVTLTEFTERTGAAARHCVRFTRGFDNPRLTIGGWLCSAGREVVDRGIIACALDRLSLLAAGSEPKVGALFARAELKRTFCGQNSVIVAATPRRADWIETARDPKLRGRQ